METWALSVPDSGPGKEPKNVGNACLTPGHPQCGRSTEAVSQALGPGLLQTASDRGCHPAPQLPGHLLSQSTYHCFEEKELKGQVAGLVAAGPGPPEKDPVTKEDPMRCGGSQLPAARRRQNWEDVAWFLSHYRIGAGHQMFPSKPRKLPMSAQGCGNWGSTAGWADPMAAVLIRSVFPAGGAGGDLCRVGEAGALLPDLDSRPALEALFCVSLPS
ncbi:hypothetical protein CB1_001533092 [Camelus ferus]|nr:hypothetical protein CB1_001533092 [Camelus ferus]